MKKNASLFQIILYVVCVFGIFHQCTYVKRPNMASGVATCDDVYQLYQYLGYTVLDCDQDQNTSSVFWRIDQLMTFDYGRQACKAALNADLAVDKNFNQRKILFSLFGLKVTKTLAWIGITQNQDGVFTYIDGSPIQPMRWSNYSSQGDACGAIIYDTSGNPASMSPPYSGQDGRFLYAMQGCDNAYLPICKATSA